MRCENARRATTKATPCFFHDAGTGTRLSQPPPTRFPADRCQISAQPASGKLFHLTKCDVDPFRMSSVWSPPAMDPLRVWPDAYDPAVENRAWAMDPMGSWKGCKGYQLGIKKDTNIDSFAFNYAFMALYDSIPCGQKKKSWQLIYDVRSGVAGDGDVERKKNNFYGCMEFICKYPTYNEMKGALGLSSGYFCEQVREPCTWLREPCSHVASRLAKLHSRRHARACACVAHRHTHTRAQAHTHTRACSVARGSNTAQHSTAHTHTSHTHVHVHTHTHRYAQRSTLWRETSISSR
jgi:hypothetical protein